MSRRSANSVPSTRKTRGIAAGGAPGRHDHAAGQEPELHEALGVVLRQVETGQDAALPRHEIGQGRDGGGGG